MPYKSTVIINSPGLLHNRNNDLPAAMAAVKSKHVLTVNCAYHENTSIAVSVNAPKFHCSSRLYQY